MQMETGSEPKWTEVEPLLDEAITVLPKKDRDAVLLRYFQRRSLREVGKELGTSEDGARKRGDRAVGKLRGFFAGKGLTLSAAFLVGALSEKAMQAAPGTLATVVRGVGHSSGAALPASALALATGALKEMFWVKARVVLGAGTLAVISALVATATWQSSMHRNQSHAARQLAALPASELRASVSNSDDAPEESARQGVGRKLPLLVVGAQGGQPLAGAGAMASYFPRTWEDAAHLNFTTDELGHCAVPVSDREFEILRIWISAPGHVPKVIDWRKYEFQAQPEEYVVRLEPGGVIGGVVKDEADQPVSQAKLRVSGVGRVSSQRENIGYRDESSSVFSDDHGHWRFDQVPMGLDTLKFFVTHPDYAKAMVFLPLAPPGFTNHVVVIKRGVEVWGTVSNRFELPVFEAAVEEVDSYGGPAVSAKTDLLGEFTLNHVNPGLLKLKIDAKGYKALTRTVLITTNAEAISFVLEEAPPEDKADAAPAPVKTVRLAGTVKDEETGQPLDRFKVLLDERRGTPGPDFLGEGRNGAFDWEYPVMFFNEYALEIQADGYTPEASPPVKVSDAKQFFEFKLKRSADITGRVMFPDGAPARGAEVWLGGEDFGPIMVMTALKKALLYPGMAANDDWSIRTFTDAEGAFRFQPRRSVNRVVVEHDSGCAAVVMNSPNVGTIVLQPWGRITGVVRSGNRAESNCSLGIQPQASASGSPEVPYSHNIQADGYGRFAFERVPPGKHRVYRITSLHGDSAGFYGISHYTPVEVMPGETSEIVIGGTGRVVVGRVNFGSHKFMPHWTTLLQTLARPTTGTPPSAPRASSDANAMRAYHRAWNEHEAKQQRYYFGLKPDGSFVVEDVLPGAYRLEIRVTEPPKDPLDPEGGFAFTPELGSLTKDVVVPEASPEQPEQPFDSGVFTLQFKAEGKVGD
ncbi:MAG: hypothetical protein DMG22_22540 [Acidobacteria bacterium]|nr:MAG: hypothetical protein DMG22_22540 [Acidobacteriota bacterium]